MNDPHRYNKPWPPVLYYVFDANMTAGTVRAIGSMLAFTAVFGTLVWWLR